MIISIEEKAKAFESLCTKLHYASVAMNGSRVVDILDAVDRYCRAGHGEYTEEERNEQRKESFKALQEV